MRAKRGRTPWALAVALLGLSVSSACSWKEGDGRSPASDAGPESGMANPIGVGGAGAGGRAGGSGGVGTGGASGGSGGRGTGGGGGVANGGSSGSGSGGVSSGGSGGVPSGGSGGGGTGGGAASGGSQSTDASLDGAADARVDASDCDCPADQYCGADATCIPGCRSDGSGCASGKCNANHECIRCISDAECAAGHVCATGICLGACGNDGVCPSDYSCCVDRCADLSRDYRSCGGCGVTCTNTEFCGATGCRSAVLTNVCDSPKATFLLDGLSGDDPISAMVRGGLVAGCPPASPAPATVLVNQTQATTIHPVSGRPVVGSGDLQVVLGGPLGQSLIRYLENQRLTPVSFTYDGVVAHFYGRSTDGGVDPIIVEASLSTLTERHDFFLIETVVDPVTGTLTLALYGFGLKGTEVAAWFFLNEVLPNRSLFDKGFYVYEWTAHPGDAGADPPPTSADTFRLVESGP